MEHLQHNQAYLPLTLREIRVKEFIQIADEALEVQLALRTAQSLNDIIAISSRTGVALTKVDLVLNYRDLNQPYFPWFGQAMQKRREFIHTGRFL
jgi:hypothetical protein